MGNENNKYIKDYFDYNPASGLKTLEYNETTIKMYNEDNVLIWQRTFTKIKQVEIICEHVYQHKLIQVKTDVTIYVLSHTGFELKLDNVSHLYPEYPAPTKWTQMLEQGTYQLKLKVDHHLTVQNKYQLYDDLGQLLYWGTEKMIALQVAVPQTRLVQLKSNSAIKIDVEAVDLTKEPIIYVIGDSTYSNHLDQITKGIGQVLALHVPYPVFNLAILGRSTSSFQQEGRYQYLLKILRSNDYVVIGFGHNDEKENEFGTSPSEYLQNIETWCTEINNLKAHSIVVTPLSRRNFVNDQLVDTHEAYAHYLRKSINTWQLIDLCSYSLDYLTSLGPEASKDLYLHYPELELADDTHLSLKGAKVFATYVGENLRI